MRLKHCLLIAMAFVACSPQKTELRDTPTETLYANIKDIVNSGKTMFGQANATTITYLDKLSHADVASGDCKDVTGHNPAFHESDFMWYRDADFMKRDIVALREAEKRGAVVGYCWHLEGMASGSFYAADKVNGGMSPDSALVKAIVANGDRASNKALDWLLTKLDSLVIPVMRELAVPMTFRPWHEMNGEWFWWGSDCCTPEEYKALYRLTVDYIRTAGVTNVLYVWSPDKSLPMEYYPGDDYVDILGMDIYEPGIMEYSSYDKILPALADMIRYADEHGKVAALTECGCRKNDDGSWRYPDQYPLFWGENVMEKILCNPQTSRLAWVMSWYGADWRGDQSNDAYIPYKGWTRPNADVATDDFIRFITSEKILTEDEAFNKYK